MKKIFACICLMLLASCGGKEELPDVRSSVGLNVSGNNNVSLTGAVNEIGQTTEISRSVAPEGWSTGPVPLSKPYGFAIATRNGRIMIYDDQDSLKRTITIGDSIVIDQLLALKNEIFAIGLNGSIHKVSAEGKTLWQNSTSRVITGRVIL
ncbi:MAG TPA: hypothetical protein VFH43_08620, partial [Candidatus Kapabacteria bacterium]|nr:hypothetical protein [Candidatus Kapabacteria bacterium]